MDVSHWFRAECGESLLEWGVGWLCTVTLCGLDETERTARHTLLPCSSDCPACEPNLFFFEAAKMELGGGYHSWRGNEAEGWDREPGQGCGWDLGAQKHRL